MKATFNMTPLKYRNAIKAKKHNSAESDCYAEMVVVLMDRLKRMQQYPTLNDTFGLKANMVQCGMER